MSALNRQAKAREDQLDKVLGALADGTRRALVQRLLEGQARVTDLAEPFGVSLNAISKHIRVLEQSGLVRRRVDGRIHYISLAPQALLEAEQWIGTTRKFWEERFNALESAIQRARQGKQRK